MIDLSKLRHAVAVAAAGSYTAAAQAIPLSQPALTRSIQSLERQYGLTLFERDKSGTRLTPDGVRFISQAERLLRHAQALEEDIQRLAAGHGATISFGIGPASAFTFLPGALPLLLESATDIRVRIRVGSNSALRNLLRSGEIDFYIGGVPQDSDTFMTSSELTVEPIAVTSRLQLIVREGHPLLKITPTRDDIAAYPLVAATFVRDTLSETDVVSLGIQRPTIEIDDYDLLTDLVRTTDAILVSSSIFSRYRIDLGVVALNLDTLTTPRPVTYALIYSSEHGMSPVAAKVSTVLVDTISAALRSEEEAP
ncbi:MULTISPECIES: LysR family transcriptional regulator [Actinomadura]|uniref:DNA-binding transcriptional regulator, LysR family n=1 Tax=Actinomadura madurae TaxID=1993 RepID=A0A1I5NMJ3_9ACTN|nr:LysR family transcriptional regulator [Actinomadura madurae]SFP23023.1 DNA-binding transcriptional regulator, LysR family [Actinomadura madurae]